MIEKIVIRNFRNLQQVSLDLIHVNLIYGNNNTGKTNLLKAIQFLGDFYTNAYKLRMRQDEFERLTFRHQKIDVSKEYNPIMFQVWFEHQDIKFFYQLEFYDVNSFSGVIGIPNAEVEDLQLKKVMYLQRNFSKHISFNETGIDYNPSNQSIRKSFKHVEKIFKNTLLLKPEPDLMLLPSALAVHDKLLYGAANLATFLFNLSQNDKDAFTELETNLQECTRLFKGVTTPAIRLQNESRLVLKLQDIHGVTYEGHEVSEGTLLVLALLAVFYQKDIPGLILLREPDRGLDLYALKQITELIFKKARERKVQVLLTSHSPAMVQDFIDNDDNFFVFEEEDGHVVAKHNYKPF
jgi:predicted ATPase